MAQNKFKLGDREFLFDGPLKLKQLRVIEPLVTSILNTRDNVGVTKMSTEDFYKTTSDILVAVISGSDKDFTLDTLNDLPMTGADIVEAIRVISIAAGMWKAPTPGEAQAPQADAA